MTIENLLLKEGRFVGPTFGISMLPMLKTGRDSVVIVKKTARLQPYDVALYKSGERYLLHRVIRPIEGGYIIRGDNCYSNEKVAEDAVFGVLESYFRGEKKQIVCATDKKYLKYAKRRVKNYPLRRFFKLPWWRFKAFCKRALLRLFGKKNEENKAEEEKK